ncbi:MAG: 4a-hydroxytetrahydrobiopterin dehydratase [Bacteroidia bacterium]|nr:4a-hydroxytetrahydrobiopterin dehydratase [Bacteroidia bacterium]
MNGWTEHNNQLQKVFTFNTCGDAMAFMVRASYIIEKMDHHPEWTNVYNRVEVKLCTHSAANTITDLDRKLALALDGLV